LSGLDKFNRTSSEMQGFGPNPRRMGGFDLPDGDKIAEIERVARDGQARHSWIDDESCMLA
jgi:hypothetical protein